jgi:imidazolonepropionase-like amidohydrolase
MAMSITTFLVLTIFAAGLHPHSAKQPATNNSRVTSGATAAETVERGKFRFYDLGEVQGEENYEITRAGSLVILKSRVELTMEDKKTVLDAVLEMRSDLTPIRFEIKGTKPSGSKIDSAVIINGQVATIREGQDSRQSTVPNRFFAALGYAPLAVEMMLIRYWRNHRGDAPLTLLPNGSAQINHRGRDVVTANGKSVRLDRYSIGGLTWGHQTLWMDDAGRLIAAVGIGGDIESTLPTILDGYESAIPFFLERAAEDAIDRLTATANQLSPGAPKVLAIVGGTLIDGTDSAALSDSVILIEAGRIIAAGNRSSVVIPKHARTIDARGKYILPGLWDMHAHLFKPEFGPAYLATGVTTVRDMGNEFQSVLTLRRAFNEGRGLGPTMLLAGFLDAKSGGTPLPWKAGTPDEARAAVRRYKSAGFEQIKVRDQLNLELLSVIAEEAHKLGLTLTGHVPRAMNALQAVEAGQDQISHINFLTPLFDLKRNSQGPGYVVDNDGVKTKRVFELFKQRGTVIDPTLAYMEMAVRPADKPIASFEPGISAISPLYAEHLNNNAGSEPPQALQVFISVVGALHKAGIPLVAGTDVVVPGHSIHRELELLVKAGFTTLEAIQAATIVPARAMKLDREVGTIEKGKRADLIIVDGDPLASISNIRKLRSVIVRGRLFDCDALRRSSRQ